MRASLGACAVALGLLAGCRFHAPAPPSTRQVIPTVGPVAAELPPTRATRIVVQSSQFSVLEVHVP